MLRCSILNEEGTKPLPATLAAAYAKTVSWVKAVKRSAADDRRVPTAYLVEKEEDLIEEENPTYLHEDSAVEDYLLCDDHTNESAYMVKSKHNSRGKFKGKCYVCGEIGHMGRQCKHRIASNEVESRSDNERKTESALRAEINDEEDEYGVDEYGYMCAEQQHIPGVIETSVSAAALATIGEPVNNTLIMDSACTIHLVGNRDLLTNIREVNTRCRVKGIAGDMSTNLVGDLQYFGAAYLVDGLGVNLISFAESEDKHMITYKRKEYMKVHVENGVELTFLRIGKLYKFRHTEDREAERDMAMVTTVAELEKKYTAREVEAARKARQVLRTLGVPSFTDVINMMLKGNILNMPITIQDLLRAREIYGRDEAEIKGKMVNKGTIKFDHVNVPRMMEKRQKLHTDIFHITGVPFLLSVAMPLDLIVVTHLNYKKTNAYIRSVINRHVDILASKGFTVGEIQVDLESGLDALKGRLYGIHVEVVGAGMHVVFAERKIRVIKERQRASKVTLCLLQGVCVHLVGPACGL